MNQETYTPTRPLAPPSAAARANMRVNESVRRRAVTGGMTRAAAIRVAPRTCREAMTVAASTRENSASTQGTGTP